MANARLPGRTHFGEKQGRHTCLHSSAISGEKYHHGQRCPSTREATLLGCRSSRRPWADLDSAAPLLPSFHVRLPGLPARSGRPRGTPGFLSGIQQESRCMSRVVRSLQMLPNGSQRPTATLGSALESGFPAPPPFRKRSF